jgi:hypothetical protein
MFGEVTEIALEHATLLSEWAGEAMRVPRGRTAGRQKVTLPEGFLEDRLTDDASPTYVDPGSGG